MLSLTKKNMSREDRMGPRGTTAQRRGEGRERGRRERETIEETEVLVAH